LLIWFGLMALVLSARGLIGKFYLAREVPADQQLKWLWALRLAALATGVIWGAVGVLFFPSGAPLHQLFTLMVLSGMAAGAISTQVADYRSLVGYDLALLLPVSGMLLAEGSMLFSAFSALAPVLLAFLLRAGHKLSEAVMTSLRLRYQNSHLLESLAREKDQLGNRLGRVLDNSSSEIYIFDADSLTCLQVNSGAADNLGYPAQALVGRPMLDFMVGMDRTAFEGLAGPLRTGEKRAIDYRAEHLRHDGSQYPVETHLQLSQAEQPPVFVATVLDVSEREASERVARKRQALMQSVLSSAPVALWSLDMEGNFTFIDGPEILHSSELPGMQLGDNIFSLFADISQVRHDARRALSGESFHNDLEIGSKAFEIHYSPLREDGRQVGAIGVALDISDRKAHEHQLYLQAGFDRLTGLPNKSHLMSGIDKIFARARRADRKVGLLFLDLDNFKNINDTLGHEAGDQLLKQAADRIRSVLRASDTPCRISGDEFLVVVEGVEEPHDVEVVARKLVNTFEAAFEVDGREIYTTSSIGICLYPDDGESADVLFQHADTAMYQAKASGRSNYQFFTQSMRDAAEHRMQIESRLRKALERGELSMVYQPKVETVSGPILGAEALMRWHNPELGQVPPDRFITVAEDSGLIEEIGAWAMDTACREAADWQSITDHSVSIAVNVSSRQFRSEQLLGVVDQALSSSGLPAALLELELTEGLLIQDAPDTMAMLNALCERQISLALDDFGTGYSSLSYLKRFPLQVLKIDRSFIRDLAIDAHYRALVEAIVAMAHSLGLSLVAEGVETTAQAEFLEQRRVALMQGYLFSKPVGAEEFRQLLQDGKSGQRLLRQASA